MTVMTMMIITYVSYLYTAGVASEYETRERSEYRKDTFTSTKTPLKILPQYL